MRLPHGLGLVLILLSLARSSAVADHLHVACWNVENLFDTVDDPAVEGDEEFTPDGPKKWDEARLRRKLGNLAGVIRKMNGGKGPDVLGLCEVENRAAVEMLVRELAVLGRKYQVVHRDSPSERGIDTAIVYDAAKLELEGAKFHGVPKIRTRDIAEAEFVVSGKPLWVFANHWPSRSHPPEERAKAAGVLRARVDAILAADPKADLVVMGDLNDYPDDPSVKEHLRAADDPAKATGGVLYDTTWPIQKAGRGTYVYQNRWEVIDHLVVSPGLLESDGLRWRRDSTTELKYPELIFDPRGDKQIPRPNRSFSGNSYHPTGVSDHLPLECVLDY
jgi:endonuclease/exonuclease/phosphatase family metal-dependent hydrolase